MSTNVNDAAFSRRVVIPTRWELEMRRTTKKDEHIVMRIPTIHGSYLELKIPMSIEGIVNTKARIHEALFESAVKDPKMFNEGLVLILRGLQKMERAELHRDLYKKRLELK